MNSQIKNIISLKLLYVLVDMLEIKFRGGGALSPGHVIHKVNFKVVIRFKGQYVLLEIRKIMTDLDSLSKYLSNNNNFMEIGLMVPEIGRLKVRRPRPFWRKMKIFGVL